MTYRLNTLVFLFRGVAILLPTVAVAGLSIIPSWSPLAYSSSRVDPQTGTAVAPNLLILHYTAATMAHTLQIFSNNPNKVSAHYTVAPDGTVYQHVDESRAAHHAGVSYWNGVANVNKNSIGIEHVNEGYKEREDQPNGTVVSGSDKQWYPFDERQIAATILLCKEIVARYGIQPRAVVGHADVAPRRKVDPGPLFPWQLLAKEGIGAWPDYTKAWPLPCFVQAQEHNTLDTWMMTHLALWGYQAPTEIVKARDIISTFQMHFRQECIDGHADEQTAQVLNALICTYLLSENRTCPCSVHTPD